MGRDSNDQYAPLRLFVREYDAVRQCHKVDFVARPDPSFSIHFYGKLGDGTELMRLSWLGESDFRKFSIIELIEPIPQA